MISLPFDSASFSREMKPKMSGSNLSLDFRNLESTLTRTAVEIRDILGTEVYDAIVTSSITPDFNKNDVLRDYLQRAILHLSLYHHAIYLIANIGNDGITIKKSEDTTTIYKYQQDELESRLISDGWFWVDRLLLALNHGGDDYPLWQERLKTFDDPFLCIRDFERFVGIKDTYFYYSILWIINEVRDSSVLSRINIADISSDRLLKVKRAACYEVVGLAVQRLAHFYLPESIRKDINNEHTKKAISATDTKEKISQIFLARAETYWQSVDVLPERISTIQSTTSFEVTKLSKEDSFCL